MFTGYARKRNKNFGDVLSNEMNTGILTTFPFTKNHHLENNIGERDVTWWLGDLMMAWWSDLVLLGVLFQGYLSCR